MISRLVMGVPSLTVGSSIRRHLTDEPEAIITLNFPEPMFSELCELTATSICRVFAGTAVEPTIVTLGVVLVITGHPSKGQLSRYTIIGEVARPLDNPHLLEFWRLFQVNGNFMVRLSLEVPTEIRPVSDWVIHLPQFESDFMTRLEHEVKSNLL